MRLNSSTLQQWDSSTQWVEQQMGETGDSFNKNIIDPAVLKILGNLSNKTILDVGCGSGYFTAQLAQSAKKVVGSDFSSNFVKLCLRKYEGRENLEFVQQDVQKPLKFSSESFDIVLAKMVLQYVPTIHTFIKKGHRVLKENGQLIIAVDHPFNTQFVYAQQLVGRVNPKYKTLDHYFSEKPQLKSSFEDKIELTWYPRTVSTYIQSFINVGFRLVNIQELIEKKETVPVPRVLLLSFQK